MATTLARWRDMFAPFEAAGGWFPFVAPEIRIEQSVEDGHYVVRAEIPAPSGASLTSPGRSPTVRGARARWTARRTSGSKPSGDGLSIYGSTPSLSGRPTREPR